MQGNHDTSDTMKRFLHAMDGFDYETAASLFAKDATFVIPPFVAGQEGFASGGVQYTEGLEDIKAKWAKRDKKTRHTIEVESISGPEWFSEGSITLDDSETRRFLIHATLNASGEIQRFLALR